MSGEPIRIAVIGLGKIARDQHLPAIRSSAAFRLAAIVSPHDHDEAADVPHFGAVEDFLESGPPVDAVALCTPPQVRYGLAGTVIAAGLHTFLEKPPGATLSEVAALQDQARRTGVTLFASWHSRFAAGVGPARAWLAQRKVLGARIIWREDVRSWHPGQAWIWQPGGLGVFDPGINALSILTHILPHPVILAEATLSLPANRAAPIAAQLALRDAAGAEISMDLDWRQTGPQTWDIEVETADGTLRLSQGGSVLDLPQGRESEGDVEYPRLYAHFAELVQRRRSDVDCAPLRLVADAFLRGRLEQVEPFED